MKVTVAIAAAGLAVSAVLFAALLVLSPDGDNRREVASVDSRLAGRASSASDAVRGVSTQLANLRLTPGPTSEHKWGALLAELNAIAPTVAEDAAVSLVRDHLVDPSIEWAEYTARHTLLGDFHDAMSMGTSDEAEAATEVWVVTFHSPAPINKAVFMNDFILVADDYPQQADGNEYGYVVIAAKTGQAISKGLVNADAYAAFGKLPPVALSASRPRVAGTATPMPTPIVTETWPTPDPTLVQLEQDLIDRIPVQREIAPEPAVSRTPSFLSTPYPTPTY